jgi:hypothetical protein
LKGLIEGPVNAYKRKHPSPGLQAYWQAIPKYYDEKAATEAAAYGPVYGPIYQSAYKAAQTALTPEEVARRKSAWNAEWAAARDGYIAEKAAQHAASIAEAAARKAALEIEMRKRSYWSALDGWAFERSTADVLSKHQFNAVVTSGSGDGGIDIEVTRNGLKGIVQCKAHAAPVGPHVVRDLYGVIHHYGADFGIVVSYGGFTQGAVGFAANKPIFFVDVSDLIAMQEGRDVLASAFADAGPCHLQPRCHQTEDRGGDEAARRRIEEKHLHHSLNSPACSCVSITLPASS